MNNDNKFVRNLIETIGLIGIMTLFTVFGIHYMSILLFLFPIAFVVIGVKNGIVQSILSMIITLIIISILVSQEWAVYLLIIFAPITVSLIQTIKKRRKSIEVLGYSAIVFFLSSLLILGLVNTTSEMSFVSQLEEVFKQILSIQIDIFKDRGLTSYQILKFKDYFEENYKSFILIIPTLLLISSLIISYINYSLSVLGLRKLGIGIVNIPRFSRFKLPSNFIPGTLVIFIALFIIKKSNFPYYDNIVLNLGTLIALVFYIQGLAIVDFYLIKLKTKFMFRLVFLTFTILMAPLMTIIPIIGLADLLFDFRKIGRFKS